MAANVMLMPVLLPRNPKTYRANDFYNYMNDRELRERYRFGRNGIEYISDLLSYNLKRKSNKNHAVPPTDQVLIALRFFATGNFLQTVGDSLGYDKSTVSRVIQDVCSALCNIADEFIQWPKSRDAKEAIKRGFFNMRGFPNVIGCVDGTHVRIQQPVDNKRAFMNRKHFPSINVMAVCDHNGKFTFVNSAWPGSNHDSLIFRLTILHDYLNAHNKDLEDGIILGDSGYACTNYLMTPYRHPQGRAQERYQAAHSSTRSVIERTFGQWKRRFAVLHGEIRMSPAKACDIVMSCAVLHNIAKNFNEPDIDPGVDGHQQPDPEPYEGPEEGQYVRDYIARAYFA